MRKTMRLSVVAVLAALPLAGCGDLLQVDAPGRIADTDLNNESAIPGLVAGMAYDLNSAYDATLQDVTIFTDELWHGGSYDYGDLPEGIVLPEDWNGEWAQLQQFRWTSETGIERMRELLETERFNRSPNVAHAYLFAGIGNRLLGELQCESVIDGGPAVSNTQHFSRGIEYLTTGIPIAQAAGRTDLVTAMRGVRASLRAWSGDWSGAVADASEVPAGFVYDVVFSAANQNDLQYETFDRPEFTVWNTFLDSDPDCVDCPGKVPDDPRAPWRIVYNNDGSVARGANGADPFYQQLKYTTADANVPVVKGTEMLVLRAEARLRNNDIAGAYALMNEARDFYGMDDLPVATTMEQAWADLHYERGTTTWLEMRRPWDLRRWYEESGPAHHDFLEGRDKCFPISDAERRSNPNIG